MLSLLTLAASDMPDFTIRDMVRAVVVVGGLGLICWLLWWVIGYIGIPEPFNKIARAIIAIFAVLVLIGMILRFMDVSW